MAVRNASITPRIDFARELAGLPDVRGQGRVRAGRLRGHRRGVAWALAQAGAPVVVAGRDAAKAEALAATLRAAGFAAAGFAMDAHSVPISAARSRRRPTWRALDLLVNCVGTQRRSRCPK